MAQETVCLGHVFFCEVHVAQGWLADNLLPEFLVFVDLPYPFHHGVPVGIVMAVNEGFRIEVISHSWVAPVDGDGLRRKRLNKFFRRIACVRGVLEGDGEFVLLLECQFVGNRTAGVVKEPPA